MEPSLFKFDLEHDTTTRNATHYKHAQVTVEECEEESSLEPSITPGPKFPSQERHVARKILPIRRSRSKSPAIQPQQSTFGFNPPIHSIEFDFNPDKPFKSIEVPESTLRTRESSRSTQRSSLPWVTPQSSPACRRERIGIEDKLHRLCLDSPRAQLEEPWAGTADPTGPTGAAGELPQSRASTATPQYRGSTPSITIESTSATPTAASPTPATPTQRPGTPLVNLGNGMGGLGIGDNSPRRTFGSPSPSPRNSPFRKEPKNPYKVENEPEPQSEYYTEAVRNSIKNTQDIVAGLESTLASSGLHQDANSTIHTQYLKAQELRMFQPPEKRVVGFIGDAGKGKSSLINSLLDVNLATTVRATVL